jgi:hypothetical protein
MSDDGREWAALASQNERLVGMPDARLGPADASLGRPTPSRWNELASQRERLADACDPLFGLASSDGPVSGPRRVTDLRRVAGIRQRNADREVVGAA